MTHTRLQGTTAGTANRIILGDPAAALDFRSHGRRTHEQRNNFSPCTTRHTYYTKHGWCIYKIIDRKQKLT